MQKTILRILTLAMLAAASGAADLPTIFTDLSSENYPAQYDARQELKALMAEASVSETNAIQLAKLEEQVLAQLNTETHKAARGWLLRMLEWFGTENSVQPLSTLLQDNDPDLRDGARIALTANPSEAATLVLRTALKNAPDGEKAMWVDALVYRNDQYSIKAISSLLKSDDPAIASKAASALGKLGGGKAAKALHSAKKKAPETLLPALETAMLDAGLTSEQAGDLVQHGSTSAIRAGAFRQLAATDPKDASKLLSDLMAETSQLGRHEIIRVAMETPDATVRDTLTLVLPASSPSDQQVILAAIADLELTEYEATLLTFLATTNSVEDATLRTLGIIGGEASFQPLYDRFLANPSDTSTRALTRLKAPSVDTALFKTLAGEPDEAKQLAAIRLLTIRAPKGTVEQFNTACVSDRPEELKKAIFKGLETVGNGESCRILAAMIVKQDPLMRPAQQSLKKLSTSLKAPDALWDSAYRPALQSAPDDAARKNLLAILDGAAGAKSLAYLDTLIRESGHPLHDDAIKSLARWPDFAAGEVWLNLLHENASPDEVNAAQKGLVRVLSKSVAAQPPQKYRLAAKAILTGPSLEFKEAILNACEKPGKRDVAKRKQSFTPLLDDPDVGLKVYALLGIKPPPSPAVEPGFTSLFNGATRTGWTQRGGRAKYTVRNGAIVGTSVLKTPNSFLCTDNTYGDFDLRFEVKCGPVNSGVQIRSADKGGHAEGPIHGPQVEIEHSPGKSGYVYGEGTGRGWLSPEPRSKDSAINQHSHFKNDDWNQYRVVAQGPRIQTYINGQLIADLTDEEAYASHPKGFIGLQVHSHKVADIDIEWRNIQIKEIQEETEPPLDPSRE